MALQGPPPDAEPWKWIAGVFAAALTGILSVIATAVLRERKNGHGNGRSAVEIRAYDANERISERQEQVIGKLQERIDDLETRVAISDEFAIQLRGVLIEVDALMSALHQQLMTLHLVEEARQAWHAVETARRAHRARLGGSGGTR